MNDIVPTGNLDASAPAAPGAPFVRVIADKTTGRVVIALDATAADALVRYLDDIGPGYDLAMNPGHYGVDDDTANTVSDVISRVSGPILRASGWL